MVALNILKPLSFVDIGLFGRFLMGGNAQARLFNRSNHKSPVEVNIEHLTRSFWYQSTVVARGKIQRVRSLSMRSYFHTHRVSGTEIRSFESSINHDFKSTWRT